MPSPSAWSWAPASEREAGESFTLRRDAQVQGFETQQAAARRAHELDVLGREESMQRERYAREDLQAFEEVGNPTVVMLVVETPEDVAQPAEALQLLDDSA